MNKVNGPRQLVFLLGLLAGFSISQGVAQIMFPEKTILPETVGGWKLAGPPRRIDASNIFDYMNGGGELYLAYRFDHMLAFEYSDGGQNDILAELYRMRNAADAFGLLSLDWGGEAIDWKQLQEDRQQPAPVPMARALYGSGLLRLCCDDLYVRIMAVRETPEAREAILKLGETIVAGRRQPPLPALLGLLPSVLEPGWTMKKERTVFFRSHLILNSLYYLSHENILGLTLSCEAVFTTYEGVGKRFHFLIVRYPEKGRSAPASEGFLKAYLPELGNEAAQAARNGKGFFQVEDGWLGFKVFDRCLALVFQCPDLESVRGIVEQVKLEK